MELFTNQTAQLWCCECGKEVDRAVHVGNQGHTMCKDCLRAAVQMLEHGQEEQPRHNYTGPINRGDRFIWEPTLPDTRQHITVTTVSEGWIETMDRRGEHYWNEESRFREAVVKDETP